MMTDQLVDLDSVRPAVEFVVRPMAFLMIFAAVVNSATARAKLKASFSAHNANFLFHSEKNKIIIKVKCSIFFFPF